MIIRIPKNINYTSDNSIIEESIIIDDYEKLEYPFIEQSLVNDKFIKRIEKVVRSSLEIREYITYLKEELDLNCCSFLTNLDIEDISIEIHHGPLTLYDITDIILRKQLSENINVTIFDICEEISLLHYQNKVGLIPLSKTIHDLLHTGNIFIPYQYFYGDWKSFYNDYNKYFTKDQINMLKNYIKLSDEVIKDMKIPDILQRKYTYIIAEGIELPKRINIEKKNSI